MLGYALKWGEPALIRSDGEPFWERFRKGAFTASIAAGRVRMCLDHEWADVVARQADGSLTLVEDEVGLLVDAWAGDTDAGDSAISAVRCRSSAGLSVSFERAGSEWTTIEGERHREITECDLREVSVCRRPAYRSSEIVAGRMRIEALLERVGSTGAARAGAPTQ